MVACLSGMGEGLIPSLGQKEGGEGEGKGGQKREGEGGEREATLSCNSEKLYQV